VREAVFLHVRLRQGEGLAELMEVIERFTPLAQSLAPSAAVAQVGGALRLFGVGPVGLAQRLRLQAAALYGLGTVVGIGPSWSVAAMASSRTGSGGVLHVPASDTADFLGPLPIGELYGIRRAQATALRSLGVLTIGQLAVLPGATVLRILGRPGRALQERARGVDHRMVVPGRAAETVSVRADSPWMSWTASRSALRLCGWPRSSGPGCGRVSGRRVRSRWWCGWLTGRRCRRPVRWLLLRRTRTIFAVLCTASWTASACNVPGYGASRWSRRPWTEGSPTRS
jgi:hypothetical protein